MEPPPIGKLTLADAKRSLAEGTHFAKGSMAPKIQAIIWFLEAGGKQALITNPENIGRALNGATNQDDLVEIVPCVPIQRVIA